MKSLNVCIIWLSTFSALFLCAFAASCNISSEFWCGSPEIARSCGVEQHCKKHWQWVEDQAKPVKLSLYYESLCPASQEFIVNHLYQTYLQIPDILDIDLVPYGLAKESKHKGHWKFGCQHGKDECEGNLIATCAMNTVKDVAKYFPFITCMASIDSRPKTAAMKCAERFPVPLQQIFNCTLSDQGKELEHMMAVRTEKLVPKIGYVPWIVINDVYTEEIGEAAWADLLKLICDTYKGQKPSACME